MSVNRRGFLGAMTALAAVPASRYEIEAQTERFEAEVARRRLRTFLKVVWPLIEPEAPFVGNWHIDAACEELEAVTRGETDRLLLNVSPGTMKSLLVSVVWPAWEWASFPHLRYLTAAYGGHLSIGDNARCRRILASDWYMRHFPLRMVGDQNAKARFHTMAGGWRIATSVGGVGTGLHPDRIIIDDPHTAAQARSDVERQRALDWFERTVSTRGVIRGVRIVIIMQRLHQQDLSGYLIGRGSWRHVRWPMRYDPNNPDPSGRDPRKEPGQLFWPALFNEERVRKMEFDLGPYGTAGQLQQQPAPEGGGLFKPEWFEIVDEIPANGPECRGWDTGGTEGDGDYTAGVKIKGPVKGIYYVTDVERGQWGAAGVDARIKLCATKDGRGCRVREEQEPGSAGKAVIAARTQSLAGFDYGGKPASGDKATRARPFRSQAEAGNVKLLRGPWNAAYLAELSVFPAGTYDDQVDGTSCAFNELTSGATVTVRRNLWG